MDKEFLKETLKAQWQEKNKDYIDLPGYEDREGLFNVYIDNLVDAIDVFSFEYSEAERELKMKELWDRIQCMWIQIFNADRKTVESEEYREIVAKTYPISIKEGAYGYEFVFGYRLLHSIAHNATVDPKPYRKWLNTSFLYAMERFKENSEIKMVSGVYYLIFEHHYNEKKASSRDIDNYSTRNETNLITCYFCYGGDGPEVMRQMIYAVPDDNDFTKVYIVREHNLLSFCSEKGIG